MTLLRSYEINAVLPCLAEEGKYRVKATLSDDVREVLPYLNAVLEKASLSSSGASLMFRERGRIMAVWPRAFTASKVTDEKDAREIFNTLRDRINDCWERRGEMTPDYSRRRGVTVLDIVKLLPMTNCRRCGEATCTAFAVKIEQEGKTMAVCAEIYTPQYAENRRTLAELLSAAGYAVPNGLG
jgi:ArsR family metal-binding transcriptional regulator